MCAILSKGIPLPHEIPGTLELGISDKIAIVMVQNITTTSFFPNLLKNLYYEDAVELDFGVIPTKLSLYMLLHLTIHLIPLGY